MAHNERGTAYWAEVLCERKHHMVDATLALVGEERMGRIAVDASRRYGRGEACSLGGCFILAIKEIPLGLKSLYKVVKDTSGENDIQRRRCNARQQNRKKRGKLAC
jgi:hypothetical protein